MSSDSSNNTAKKSENMNHEQIEALNERWKEAIEVQMHFNEITIRNRTLVFTVGSALIAAAAGLREMSITWLPIVGIAAIIFLYIMYILDRGYYFPMLLGAVQHTTRLDKDYREHLSPIQAKMLGLTEEITNAVDGSWPRKYSLSATIVSMCYLLPMLLMLAFLTGWACHYRIIAPVYIYIMTSLLIILGTAGAQYFIRFPGIDKPSTDTKAKLNLWHLPIVRFITITVVLTIIVLGPAILVQTLKP